MADTAQELDYGNFEIRTVERLREPRVQPVPDRIVKWAQEAVDGKPHPDGAEGHVTHTIERHYPSMVIAKAVAKHLRNAGAFTSPASTIRPVIDPHGEATEDGPVLVRWQASQRKGPKPVDPVQPAE